MPDEARPPISDCGRKRAYQAGHRAHEPQKLKQVLQRNQAESECRFRVRLLSLWMKLQGSTKEKLSKSCWQRCFGVSIIPNTGLCIRGKKAAGLSRGNKKGQQLALEFEYAPGPVSISARAFILVWCV